MSALHAAASVLLVGLLAAACASDVRSRRIPNSLVLVVGACGLLFSLVAHGVTGGLASALPGVLVGLLLWLPLYVVRWMGAGDVKLVAALGAWLGPLVTVEASVYAAVLGAVLAVVWTLVDRGLQFGLLRLVFVAARPLAAARQPMEFRRKLPYALPIAGGVLVAFWRPGLLF